MKLQGLLEDWLELQGVPTRSESAQGTVAGA